MIIKKSFEFFKHLHSNQKYSDGEPYWPHLYRAGLLIKNTLILNKEGSKREINEITTAAFGHDSLEDTKVKETVLIEKFGKRVTFLIKGMTNEEGDSNTDSYVTKVCESEEEIRLIKLADICDNLSRIIHRPVDKFYLRQKILPIIMSMQKEIIKTRFIRFPKSSLSLINISKILSSLARDVLK